jgi:hypothetical protein
VAGRVNFKRQYAPDFPRVQILEATPQRAVTRGELEALGVVAARPMRCQQSARAGVPQTGKPKPGPAMSVVCETRRWRTTATGRM